MASPLVHSVAASRPPAATDEGAVWTDAVRRVAQGRSDRCLILAPRSHPYRRAVEDCIRDVYAARFAARGLAFPHTLLALLDGRRQPLCAAGLRTEAEGFFSEVYLDEPVEQVLSGRAMLGARQLLWSARALAQIVGANNKDVYLSVLPLPLPLLLETICAVVVPILAGACVRLEPEPAASFERADGGGLAAAVERHRPSCMVLVPDLLAHWVARLKEANATAPASLRVVAVGGAAVPTRLAERAWRRNIPVYEGYGLSECGSVVSLNTAGARRAGTAGRPLPGLRVTVEDGEITVRGPSVMDRYLHGAATGGVWHTGDVGAFDRDGYLIVRGRRDNVLVTPSGRNVSPEWIEAMLAADTALVAHGMVTLDAEGELTAVIIPTAEGAKWFAASSDADIHALVADCCRDAPGYAVPRRVIWLPGTDPVAAGLVTGNGRIRRAALRAAALCAAGARYGHIDTGTMTEQRAEP